MKDEMTIRKADIKDLEAVFSVFQRAIDVMNKNGIPQWDDIYPDKGVLREDIFKGEMFLVEIERQIVSAFVINRQCAAEYENGNWSKSQYDAYGGKHAQG